MQLTWSKKVVDISVYRSWHGTRNYRRNERGMTQCFQSRGVEFESKHYWPRSLWENLTRPLGSISSRCSGNEPARLVDRTRESGGNRAYSSTSQSILKSFGLWKFGTTFSSLFWKMQMDSASRYSYERNHLQEFRIHPWNWGRKIAQLPKLARVHRHRLNKSIYFFISRYVSLILLRETPRVETFS